MNSPDIIQHNVCEAIAIACPSTEDSWSNWSLKNGSKELLISALKECTNHSSSYGRRTHWTWYEQFKRLPLLKTYFVRVPLPRCGYGLLSENQLPK